jgi:hypothetical protein
MERKRDGSGGAAAGGAADARGPAARRAPGARDPHCEPAQCRCLPPARRRPAAHLRAAEALLDNDLPSPSACFAPTSREADRRRRDPDDGGAGRAARPLPDAEKLLRRALELAPAFAPPAPISPPPSTSQNRPAEAIESSTLLSTTSRRKSGHQNLKAAALWAGSAATRRRSALRAGARRFPDQPKMWMSYGHALKTVGRPAGRHRRLSPRLELAPTLGELWWSLANLKTVRLGDDDVAAMEEALDRPRARPATTASTSISRSAKPVRMPRCPERSFAIMPRATASAPR